MIKVPIVAFRSALGQVLTSCFDCRAGMENENEVNVEVNPRLGQVLHSLNAVRNFEEPLQHIRRIRDEVALLNSQYVPQMVDRSRGRFYKREKRGLVDDGEDGDLSDDDCIAVPFDHSGKMVVEHGLIERMIGTSAHGGRHSRTQVSRASINDDNVTVIARFFEEVKGAAHSKLPPHVLTRADGRRIFRLLQDPKDGIRRVSMDAVLAKVDMEYDQDEKVYFLDKEDEKNAQHVFDELFSSEKRKHEEASLRDGPSGGGASKKVKK